MILHDLHGMLVILRMDFVCEEGVVHSFRHLFHRQAKGLDLQRIEVHSVCDDIVVPVAQIPGSGEVQTVFPGLFLHQLLV